MESWDCREPQICSQRAKTPSSRSGSRRGCLACAARACRRRRAGQVLGDVLLAGVELFGELADAELVVPQQVEQPHAHRLGEGAEPAGDQLCKVFGKRVWGVPCGHTSKLCSCMDVYSDGHGSCGTPRPPSSRRAPGGSRPYRSARRVRRRPHPGGLDRVGGGRGGTRGVRAEGGDGALRGGLAGERVAVGAGAYVDPAELRRLGEFGADRRRPLADTNGALTRVRGDGGEGGGCPALRPADRNGRAAAVGFLDLARRSHRPYRRRREDRPDGNGRGRRRAEGKAACARITQGQRLADRRLRDVVGLERCQPDRDDEVGARIRGR